MPEQLRAELYTEIHSTFERHIAAHPHELDILTLWTAYCHVWRSFQFAPRLLLWSATPAAGKTTVLDILSCLIPSCQLASTISKSSFFRKIAATSPVMLLDEADKWLGKDDELTAALNAGHKRNGTVLISTPTAKGDYEPTEFTVYAPAAIAAKNRQPPSDLISRSIRITMARSIAPVPFSLTEHEAGLKELCGRGVVALTYMQFPKPVRPEWLHGRTWDNWAPLFVVAGAAGPAWQARAEAAALILTDTPLRDLDLEERLLHDIYRLLNGTERVHSESLATALNRDEELPWGQLNHGRGINTHILANMLGKFGIKPGAAPFRLNGGVPKRGYAKSVFVDAWARYGITQPE